MAVLKLLRNNTLFETRELALADIQSRAETLSDGEMWIATWGTQQENKSILAVKRNSGVTVFDLDAVTDSITDSLNELEERLADVAFSGSASDVSIEEITGDSTKVSVTGETVPEQIESLATTIKTIEDNAEKYKLLKLTDAEVAALSEENVKEAYKVVTFQGEETAQTVYRQVGDTVKIYKDSSLKEVYLGSDADTVDPTTGVVTKQQVTDPQSMNFVYQLANGTYSLTKIDVSKFLSETEFADGLQVANAAVSVKIDLTSADAENFLSVSSDGVKISGIQNAINESVENLNEYVLEIERVASESLNDLESRKAEKTELESLSGSVIDEIEAGNGIEVSAKVSNKQTVSVKLDTVKTDNALTLTSDGLYLSEVTDCGEY